jgi:hypothetical protein
VLPVYYSIVRRAMAMPLLAVFAGVSKRKSMIEDTSVAGESANDSTPSHDEERMALRWRRAILKLSETLMDAAGERSDLSPILMEAMHNALEKLLVYGEEDDLMTLEEWLSEENPDAEESSPQERSSSPDR